MAVTYQLLKCFIAIASFLQLLCFCCLIAAYCFFIYDFNGFRLLGNSNFFFIRFLRNALAAIGLVAAILPYNCLSTMTNKVIEIRAAKHDMKH